RILRNEYEPDLLVHKLLKRRIEVITRAHFDPHRLDRGLRAFISTPTLAAPGTTSSASASCFPGKLSNEIRIPVTLPPGRASRAARPKPTGSTIVAATIGIDWVTCVSARAAALVVVKMTSGLSLD